MSIRATKVNRCMEFYAHLSRNQFHNNIKYQFQNNKKISIAWKIKLRFVYWKNLNYFSILLSIWLPLSTNWGTWIELDRGLSRFLRYKAHLSINNIEHRKIFIWYNVLNISYDMPQEIFPRSVLCCVLLWFGSIDRYQPLCSAFWKKKLTHTNTHGRN